MTVEFKEDIPYRGGWLWLDGTKYREYIDTLLAPLVRCHGQIPMMEKKVPNVGSGLFFYRRMLPKGQPLSMMTRRDVIGHVEWDTDVDIPIMAEQRELWMSFTPNEIVSQRAGIRKARGTVLVGGMGMGWFARRCLERDSVTKVTVVDKSCDILDYFGMPLLEEYPDRLELVCDDAYQMKVHQFDSVLYDIWPDMGGSLNDGRWKKLIGKHPNAWAW